MLTTLKIMRWIKYFLFLLLNAGILKGQNYKTKVYKDQQDTSIDYLLVFVKPEITEDGNWKSIYANGVVSQEFTIKNGVLDGRLRWYWPNGNIMYSGYIKNGQVKRKWLVYSSNGTLAKKFIYGEYGRIKNLKQYDEGKLISETFYDEEGDEIRTIKK